MTEAQRVMFELLTVFDAVCKEMGWSYWLDHGTLLGAVRHKGFIPWDDDLDVTMPREDYEAFLKVASQKLPDHIFLQTKKSDPTSPNHYAKLRDRRSTYIESCEEGRKIAYHQGIFIDIFPVNTIKKSDLPRHRRLLNFAKIFSNRYFHWDRAAKFLIDRINALHTPEGEMVVSGGETMHDVIRVPKERVWPLKKSIFESKEFPIPGNSDFYLKSIFGNDYMTPPPEHKRRSHSVTIYTDQPCTKERDGLFTK